MEILSLISQGRFPSPLIVEGADALGFSNLIASHALCDQLSACGECPSCKKLKKDFHPDWIKLPDDFKLDDIRAALHQLRQRPFESKYRFLCVPNLNSQRIQIQNALLKTLEEPSPAWILVLTTESRWSLLDTVRSRCLVYHLNRAESVELSDEESGFFRAVAERDELRVQSYFDSLIKDRGQARDIFERLLKTSSARSHPGAWRDLAPFLEEGLSDLNRNLHQKIVWDQAWARSNDLLSLP